MASERTSYSRRTFIERGGRAAAAAVLAGPALRARRASQMRFGLVTYQWGRDWNLPTLIRNCQRAGAMGVELRVDHAHNVSAALSPRRRAEVRLRFENSPVEVLGMGANWAFHYPDQTRLWEEIAGAKEDIKLSHDIGGTGVKVKPNALSDGVPHEQTIEQIGRSLNHLARFAADYGQEVRVEVHGRGTQQLPVMAQIFEVADHPNAVVCWNCNDQDLGGQGLEHNFNLVKDRFGQTAHVREFNVGDYPYERLMDLFMGMGYDGWILMEARTEPEDRVEALAEQRALFDQMTAPPVG